MDKIINHTVEQMIHGIIIDSIIPQRLLTNSIEKAIKDIITELSRETFIEQKSKQNTKMMHFAAETAKSKLF